MLGYQSQVILQDQRVRTCSYAAVKVCADCRKNHGRDHYRAHARPGLWRADDDTAGVQLDVLSRLRYEPCSPTCANWLRYGITPKNPQVREWFR